jgi:hypothetical protein
MWILRMTKWYISQLALTLWVKSFWFRKYCWMSVAKKLWLTMLPQNAAKLQSTTLRNQFQLIEHRFKAKRGTPIHLPSVNYPALAMYCSVNTQLMSCHSSRAERPPQLQNELRPQVVNCSYTLYYRILHIQRSFRQVWTKLCGRLQSKQVGTLYMRRLFVGWYPGCKTNVRYWSIKDHTPSIGSAPFLSNNAQSTSRPSSTELHIVCFPTGKIKTKVIICMS